tara:strand:+ start:751 stop:942 length:192 start_codon:yes stop_codon:yes gene_type:complete
MFYKKNDNMDKKNRLPNKTRMMLLYTKNKNKTWKEAKITIIEFIMKLKIGREIILYKEVKNMK